MANVTLTDYLMRRWKALDGCFRPRTQESDEEFGVRFRFWLANALDAAVECGLICANATLPAWRDLTLRYRESPPAMDAYFDYRKACAGAWYVGAVVSFPLSLADDCSVTQRLSAIQRDHALYREASEAHHVRLSVPDFRWLMCAVQQFARPSLRADAIDVQYTDNERALGYGAPSIPDRVALVPLSNGTGTWSLYWETTHCPGTAREEIETAFLDDENYATEREAIRAISAYYEGRKSE
jgi:hypothetical protein